MVDRWPFSWEEEKGREFIRIYDFNLGKLWRSGWLVT